MKNILVSLVVIATWTGHWTALEKCEDEKNPYTGQPVIERAGTQSLGCLVKHSTKMKKEFKSVQEYEEFKKGCPQKNEFMLETWCTDWEINVCRNASDPNDTATDKSMQDVMNGK